MPPKMSTVVMFYDDWLYVIYFLVKLQATNDIKVHSLSNLRFVSSILFPTDNTRLKNNHVGSAGNSKSKCCLR